LLLSRPLADDPNFDEIPRGFLFKVENEEYWTKCQDCFSSLPVANLENEPAEHWFTEEHNHD